MELKGNKGEWSELYAFFKLLADGRLYCADGHLNRYDDKYYPILEIFRSDSVDRNSYKIQAAKNSILIAGNTINVEIPQERFRSEAIALYNRMKSMKTDADFSYLESFLNEIDVHSIKAKSSDKADIRIVIHNLNTGSRPELGYSVKSEVGANPTLINTNKDGTNFLYVVENVSDEQMKAFNELKFFKDKFDYLESIGAKVKFCRTVNKIFHNNLILLDLGIERIVAEALLVKYSGKERNICDVVEKVAERDPLGILNDTNQPMYEYKVKQFLLAFALGLTSSTPWYGKFQANGGYIVVKEDGDVVCFHFFDRNDLEDYLYYNTFFETPSTSRHEYGSIFKGEDSKYYLKLNIQVRFN